MIITTTILASLLFIWSVLLPYMRANTVKAEALFFDELLKTKYKAVLRVFPDCQKHGTLTLAQIEYLYDQIGRR